MQGRPLISDCELFYVNISCVMYEEEPHKAADSVGQKC